MKIRYLSVLHFRLETSTVMSFSSHVTETSVRTVYDSRIVTLSRPQASLLIIRWCMWRCGIGVLNTPHANNQSEALLGSLPSLELNFLILKTSFHQNIKRS